MIPITRLSVGQAEAAAAFDVINSGWIAQGKRTEEFERLVAAYVGAKNAIAVNSATTGLHLALIGAGVVPGDEVICPSYTFIATANAIVNAGATPVFVDIDRQTYNIDTCIIDKTQKQTSEETTQIESTSVSILVESDTSSPTAEGNILKLNLVDTT